MSVGDDALSVCLVSRVALSVFVLCHSEDEGKGKKGVAGVICVNCQKKNRHALLVLVCAVGAHFVPVF